MQLYWPSYDTSFAYTYTYTLALMDRGAQRNLTRGGGEETFNPYETALESRD